MTDTSLDELGPVDYVVVEFPAGASNFTGEMVKELLALVNAGTIRVIDVLILTKDDDGAVEATELSDVGELGAAGTRGQLAELLAEEDVEHLAAAMEPGSTAGVLDLGELVAVPFAAAARRSGGQLIANGRIPIQAIIASIEADEALTEGADNAPRTSTRRKSRCHRRARSEDRGRGQSRHTGPRDCSEDCGRGRGRHTWAPSADLASIRWSGSASLRLLPDVVGQFDPYPSGEPGFVAELRRVPHAPGRRSCV